MSAVDLDRDKGFGVPVRFHAPKVVGHVGFRLLAHAPGAWLSECGNDELMNDL
jgi:hypothetical protein